MSKKIILLLSVILVISFVPSSFAHVAKIAGDYKIDVGWEKEPPIENEFNRIEILITIATNFDKQRFDKVAITQIGELKNTSHPNDVTGLAQKLEAIVKLGDKKNTLTLVEDTKFSGIYYGEYIPQDSGNPSVHVYGQIKNIQFEATFHPEKIEKSSKPSEMFADITIPKWIKTNAGWWANGQIDDNTFIQGIQFLIQKNIIEIPDTRTNQEIESNEIPTWIKANARWWSEEQIDDATFVQGIQFLIKNGVLRVQ